MSSKAKKITASVVFIFLGIVLCVYGLTLHATAVAGEEGDGPAVAMSEPALIKEASIGGVTLDDKSGKIKQTYTGKAPDACST
jgi:uncharacterized membrane protein